MDPQIQSAIITVALTVVAGIVGYIFREYLNRLHPFIAITGVAGDMKKLNRRINIPERLCEALTKSNLLGELEETDTLRNTDTMASDIKKILDGWDEFKVLIEQILDGTNKKDQNIVENALYEIISNTTLESCIILLLDKNAVKPQNTASDLPIVIQSRYSSNHEGCFYLDFSGESIYFGRNFDKLPVRKERCQRFVSLIERMDWDRLRDFFVNLKSQMENEVRIAKEINSTIIDINNENSQWQISVYLANLSSSPILLNRGAQLHVTDKAGKMLQEFKEDCYLVLHKKNEDEETTLADTNSPLIISAQSDASFSFLTTSVQKEMERGRAFREAFTTGKAIFWMEFNIERIGIWRKQIIKTPNNSFAELKK